MTELERIQTYRGELLAQRHKFSAGIEGALDKAFSFASTFDIETGGLQPNTPIYEMAFQHGFDSPEYKQAFVSPTNIAGTGEGEISKFTQNLLSSRASSHPKGVYGAIGDSGISQRGAARMALSEMSGRDVWVQNLDFERRFLSARTDKADFHRWAKGSKLESISKSGGLYETSYDLKLSLNKAKEAAFSGEATQDEYLKKWGSVFGEFRSALEGPREAGVTRVFDTADLTRSVYALAQQEGALTKTGEVFTGTSMETISQLMYGKSELHTAGGDSALQAEVTRFMYGAGLKLEQGKALNTSEASFFKRLGEVQQVDKKRGAVKNILNVYNQQQQYMHDLEMGNPVEPLRDARVKYDPKFVQSDLDVRVGGEYTKKPYSYTFGGRMNPGDFSLDINEVVESWKVRDSKRHGIKTDWDAALSQFKEAYQTPFERSYAETGNRAHSLRLMESTAEDIHAKINDSVSKAVQGSKTSSSMANSTWLSRNWKMSAGAAGGVALMGYLFSGSDDEYNYIEGMRHGGFSGQNRKHMTDFGSGWQGLAKELGLNPMHHGGNIGIADVTSWRVEDADTVMAMLNGGNEIALRLSGIDAPEVGHDDAYARGRVFQDQPHGKEATLALQRMLAQQGGIQAIFDPGAGNTYGRTPAMLIGEGGVNLNLELVKQGHAAALPYGKRSGRLEDSSEFRRAEAEAAEAGRGMWSDAGWQAVRDGQTGNKRKITHNTFTQLERLFSNFRASAITHRLRNPDSDLADMSAYGGKDDANILEGLDHGWVGASRGLNLGDFESPYVIDKKVPTMKMRTKTRRKLMRGQRVANTHARVMMNRENWTKHHVG